MKQKLSAHNRILMGFTLFSMFFGAGNLIFPPFMGAMAGEQTPAALGGFLISAVGLPVLGVAAVALCGGLSGLAGRVSPWFASLFVLLVYLSIGPCLAIPRTASTSFEMALLPYLRSGQGLEKSAQLIYSILFFGAAGFVAVRPERLSDTLGKVLCPALLILIGVIFAGCLIWPFGAPGAAQEAYSEAPAVRGFLEGYQTMDTMAALNFGAIIGLNIREKGVREDYLVIRETVWAGLIAGVMMTLIYGALSYIGAPMGRALPGAENGARILTLAADSLYGQLGMTLLGLTFLIACFNTCAGLLCCCSEYFVKLLPAVGYKGWVLIFAFVSMVSSNAGLNQILAVSVPVLNVIYPVAIVLIFLELADRLVRRRRAVYVAAVSCVGIVSFLYALEQSGILGAGGQVIESAFGWLPGYGIGLGWILPGAAGILVGFVADALGSGRSAENEKDGQGK